MEGKRAVALDKHEEPYRRPQPHDQSPADSCSIQSSWICHQWQNANDCQYKDDDPASPKMPAVHVLQVTHVFVEIHRGSTHSIIYLKYFPWFAEDQLRVKRQNASAGQPSKTAHLRVLLWKVSYLCASPMCCKFLMCYRPNYALQIQVQYAPNSTYSVQGVHALQDVQLQAVSPPAQAAQYDLCWCIPMI